MPYAALIELVTLAVASLVQPGRSAIRCVCPALRLTLAARFPGLVWLLALLRLLLLLLLLIAGLALLLLLGSLLKLLLLLRCLLLTGLILLRALLGLLVLLCLVCLLLLLQLPLCLLLPRRLFLQGALADGVFGLPTLLLLLTRRVNLLALLALLVAL